MLSLLAPSPALAQVDGAALLQRLADYPHVTRVDHSVAEVSDHEVGLGAMQKVRGVWRFKESERLSGELTRSTWQVIDGFTSQEVLENLQAELEAGEGVTLLYSCAGRACGHAAQWANRVFRQRLLYGRQDLQQYRVYATEGEAAGRVVIYASARTADRQYLQVDVLLTAE
jgi:hypothetical protein